MTRKNDKDDMMCSVKKTEYAKYVVSSGPSWRWCIKCVLCQETQKCLLVYSVRMPC